MLINKKVNIKASDRVHYIKFQKIIKGIHFSLFLLKRMLFLIVLLQVVYTILEQNYSHKINFINHFT